MSKSCGNCRYWVKSKTNKKGCVRFKILAGLTQTMAKIVMTINHLNITDLKQLN